MGTSKHERFELHRKSDDLVYIFVRSPSEAGRPVYQRQDQDHRIIYRDELGWVAWEEASQSVTGRPWDVQPQDQGDHPPEGVWVSRKGPKSYVYNLVYVGA